MKITKLLSSFIVIGIVLAARGGEPQDSRRIKLAINLKNLHLVTENPHPMMDSTSLLCRPPASVPDNIHEGYHDIVYCNVYANDSAKQTLLSGDGLYPVGSVIVKSKLKSKDKAEVELFTVMQKMDADYDPKNGNWDYSVVDGRSHRILASGRIDSCIACHAEYRKTDFVTRTYLAAPTIDKNNGASPRK